MKKLNQESPTLTLLDRLEAKHRIKQEFFDVQLPGDEKIKFRHILTVTERKAMNTHVARFVELIQNGKGIPPAWKPYLPIDPEVAASLAVVSYLSVEPKLSDFDVVRLHSMPFIADLISFQVQTQVAATRDMVDLQEIEESKKNSQTTDTSDSD